MNSIRQKLLFSQLLMLFSCMSSASPVRESGYAAMQGRRPTMEDRHVLEFPFGGNQQDGFYAIFDGHGGIGVAEFARKHLAHQFLTYLKNKQYNDPEQAFTATFLKIDERYFKHLFGKNNGRLHTSTDQGLEGSTALCVYLHENSMFIAHVGDSRAVLSRGGSAIALTRDHKPHDPVERERIEQAGGRVIWHVGTTQPRIYRVNGILAVARALGDYYLKKPAQINNIITAEPAVSQHICTRQDEFLILACDGVWDVLSNQQAVTIVRQSLKAGKSATQSAQDLIGRAYQSGSTDNMSAIVLVFSNFS